MLKLCCLAFLPLLLLLPSCECFRHYNYTLSQAPHAQLCGDMFQCLDGSCVALTSECDSVADCRDGSDELCCDAGWLSCFNGECVKDDFECDDIQDCSNNLDEMFCGGVRASLGTCHDRGECSKETVLEANLTMCVHMEESECERFPKQSQPQPICAFPFMPQLCGGSCDDDELCDLPFPHPCCAEGPRAEGVSFDYGTNGPSTWATSFPEYCAGQKQSPIDIVTASATVANPGAITLTGWDTAMSGKIVNSGSSIVFQFSSEGVKPSISGGRIVKDSYNFLQLHFHWGATDSEGSEHTVDGSASPLCMHMVHTLEGSDNPTGVPNGLAVLGFLFEISATDNTTLKPFTDAIAASSLTAVGDIGTLDNIKLSDFVASDGVGDVYYYYSGGLTTPRCNEAVLWTVYEKKVPISAAQLGVFRSFSGGTLNGNFRPPLPLNGRIVRKRDPSVATDGPIAMGQLYLQNRGFL